MASLQARRYFCGSFFVGIALAALFGILALVDSERAGAYIAAAVVCGVAGVVGGIVCLAIR
jgi:uncharacterized membrane protein